MLVPGAKAGREEEMWVLFILSEYVFESRRLNVLLLAHTVGVGSSTSILSSFRPTFAHTLLSFSLFSHSWPRKPFAAALQKAGKEINLALFPPFLLKDPLDLVLSFLLPFLKLFP